MLSSESPTTGAALGLGVMAAAQAIGIDPMLALAGAAGALWAQFYLPQMEFAVRIGSVILGSFIAAWTAPALAAALPAVPGLELVREDGPRRWLRFDSGELTAADAVGRVMAVAAVHDLTVEEPAIEDIVRQIWAAGEGER